MKKRVLSVFLALMLLLALFPTALAAGDASSTEEKAQALYEMGLFKGKGTNADGSPDFALSDSATRNEAATMLIRLLGKESKASAQYSAGNLKSVFTDLPAWAKASVTWLYENDYVNGTSATKFSGSSTITAQQYAAFLLRSLGYSESAGDFTYAGALDFAVKQGLLTSQQKAEYSQSFGRAGMVEMSYNALYANTKRSSRTLLETLTDNGLFTKSSTALASTAKTTLTLKYKGGGYDSKYYVQEATLGAPIIYDLNGNGSKEIIYSGRTLFCLDGATGKVIWRVPSGSDRSNTSASPYADANLPPQLVDVDGDGIKEIVTVHTNFGSGTSVVAVYTASGYFKSGWPQKTSYPVRAMTISDLDNDGKQEICLGLGVGATLAPAIYVYESDGSIRSGWPQQCDYGLYSDSIAAADLDKDGMKELVCLFDSEQIAAFNADGTAAVATGGVYAGCSWKGLPLCENLEFETYCAQYAQNHKGYCYVKDLTTASIREQDNCLMGTSSGIAATDLDGNGTTELVCVSMILRGSMIMNGDPDFSNTAQYFTPFILNTDRTRYTNTSKGYDWSQIPTDVSTLISISSAQLNNLPAATLTPTTVDIDGDGNKEILYSANDGMVHCWSLDKTEHGAWPFDLNSRSSSVNALATRPVCADINGDGKQEVIFATYTQKNQTAQRGTLYILDYTGRVLASEVLPVTWGDGTNIVAANGARATPAVGDLDGDGKYEVALTTLYCGLVVYDIG